MDYRLIFRSLFGIVITWGGTVQDIIYAAVNVAFNHQSSLDRQIRSGVYLRCNEAESLRGERQVRVQHPGKASQGDPNQIVPITDTGSQVE